MEEARIREGDFQVCNMMHARREANMEAHLLVKSALSILEDKYWIEECPDSIMSTVFSDWYHP